VIAWRGHGWMTVPTKNYGSGGTSLYGTFCESASLCVHVGEYQPASVQRTLVLSGT